MGKKQRNIVAAESSDSSDEEEMNVPMEVDGDE